MKIPQEYLILYIIANFISLGLLVITIISIKKSKILFGILFLGSALFNIYKVLTNPNSYIRFFGKTTLLEQYKNFIYEDFRDKLILYILLISASQLLIAWFLFNDNNSQRYGIYGGIIFFVILIPLGIGSGFPSTILLAIALYLIHVKTLRKANEKIHSRSV